MKKSAIGLLVLMIFLSRTYIGGAEYAVDKEVTHDKIAKTTTTTYTLNAQELARSHETAGTMYFSVIRQDEKGNKNYTFVVGFFVPGGMNILPDKSLIFILNGRRMVLSGSGSVHQQSEAGGVIETSLYPIEANTLKRMATAKKIELQLVGKYKYDTHFTRSNLENYRRFVKQYVK